MKTGNAFLEMTGYFDTLCLWKAMDEIYLGSRTTRDIKVWRNLRFFSFLVLQKSDFSVRETF